MSLARRLQNSPHLRLLMSYYLISRHLLWNAQLFINVYSSFDAFKASVLGRCIAAKDAHPDQRRMMRDAT